MRSLSVARALRPLLLSPMIWAACGGDGDAAIDASAPTVDAGGVGDAAAPDATTPTTCDGDHLVTADGCDEGKCSLQFSPSFTVVVGCCPAGSVGLGGACNPTAAPALDHEGHVCDDCAPGLVCRDFVCHQVCDPAAPVCPAGTACVPIPGIPDAPDFAECE